MFSAADLPQTLPVFPLPGALLLPRARLPLHIFEPRYLAMLDDALKTSHRLIGMVQPCPTPPSTTPPGTTPPSTTPPEDQSQPLHDIGCAGRISAFSETDDGRYMITLSGVSRFRIQRDVTGFTSYKRMDVDWTPFARDLGNSETDPGFDRANFLTMLRRYFDTQDLSTDWDSLKSAEDELLINSLSMLCPFGPEDKQALLETPSLRARRETLVTLIEYALLGGGGGEERMQ